MLNHVIKMVLLLCLIGCKSSDFIKYDSKNENFQFLGRVEHLNNGVALISPGATVSINFSGNHSEVFLSAERPPYNYVSIELDGNYLGRVKIKNDSIIAYPIKADLSKTEHTLKIIKETEASHGYVLFNGIKVKGVLKQRESAASLIEFIGDSMTCGALSDRSETPCGNGTYFDNENVYYSYGAILSRKLRANYVLSSVSGIGMYRNWNDEDIDEPIMPEVYQNLYLDDNRSKKINLDQSPAIVSVCLGTNDLSHGDGIKARLPFNKDKYITNYIDFIKLIIRRYPNAEIVLLNSPMVGGGENEILISCLNEIWEYFNKKQRSIHLFLFDKTYTNGCNWHPSVSEHRQIAKKLAPTFRKLL